MRCFPTLRLATRGANTLPAAAQPRWKLVLKLLGPGVLASSLVTFRTSGGTAAFLSERSEDALGSSLRCASLAKLIGHLAQTLARICISFLIE